MSATGLEIFGSTLQKANLWLNNIIQEFGREGDTYDCC